MLLRLCCRVCHTSETTSTESTVSALEQIATDEKELESAVKQFSAALELEHCGRQSQIRSAHTTSVCSNALGRYRRPSATVAKLWRSTGCAPARTAILA